jgi:hypothetical protein
VAPGRERLLVHLTVLAVNPIRRGSIRSKSGSQESNPISFTMTFARPTFFINCRCMERRSQSGSNFRSLAV